ncbi:unnamed protein product [Closterium sp. NIES-54]
MRDGGNASSLDVARLAVVAFDIVTRLSTRDPGVHFWCVLVRFGLLNRDFMPVRLWLLSGIDSFRNNVSAAVATADAAFAANAAAAAAAAAAAGRAASS